MGLDMYLTAKQNFYPNFRKEDKPIIKKVKKIFPDIFESGNLNTIGISFECGYWRKANHIHKWFVENCQNGQDDCKESFVSKEQLIELKELCEKVLKNKKIAKKNLPTQEGFFFGSTEMDKWYFETLKETIDIVNKCLELPDKWEFSYQSSW